MKPAPADGDPTAWRPPPLGWNCHSGALGGAVCSSSRGARAQLPGSLTARGCRAGRCGTRLWLSVDLEVVRAGGVMQPGPPAESHRLCSFCGPIREAARAVAGWRRTCGLESRSSSAPVLGSHRSPMTALPCNPTSPFCAVHITLARGAFRRPHHRPQREAPVNEAHRPQRCLPSIAAGRSRQHGSAAAQSAGAATLPRPPLQMHAGYPTPPHTTSPAARPAAHITRSTPGHPSTSCCPGVPESLRPARHLEDRRPW